MAKLSGHTCYNVIAECPIHGDNNSRELIIILNQMRQTECVYSFWYVDTARVNDHCSSIHGVIKFRPPSF